MVKEGITFGKGGVQAQIPEELYMAIVRVQAAERLGWKEACLRAAELSDSGSEEFKKKVSDEARRLHNSELMQQMNKARGSIHVSGYNSGYAAGRKAYQLWYYCNVCGEGLWLEKDGEAHKAIIQMMKEAGWGHQKCHEKEQ